MYEEELHELVLLIQEFARDCVGRRELISDKRLEVPLQSHIYTLPSDDKSLHWALGIFEDVLKEELEGLQFPELQKYTVEYEGAKPTTIIVFF